jgi:hypothetical protein
MPRPRRITVQGVAYHVINRRVMRLLILKSYFHRATPVNRTLEGEEKGSLLIFLAWIICLLYPAHYAAFPAIDQGRADLPRDQPEPNQRCQDDFPRLRSRFFSSFLLGRPRGRWVDSRPSRDAIRRVQAKSKVSGQIKGVRGQIKGVRMIFERNKQTFP